MELHTVNFNDKGYTLAGLLTMIAVMSVFMALSVPLWSWVRQRENEEELIFRGREYVEAIQRYHARFNSYPPDLDTLLEQKFLRKAYKDPMTKSGKWKVLRPDSLVQAGVAGQINQPALPGGDENDQPGGLFPSKDDREKKDSESKDKSAGESEQEEPETEVIGPVAGVVSRSKKKSIKVFNGQESYDKWVFVFAAPQQQQQPRQGQQPPRKTPNKGTQKKQKTPSSQEEQQ
jgi:type II secretory pathway pseudopilin PulG